MMQGGRCSAHVKERKRGTVREERRHISVLNYKMGGRKG